MYSLGYTGLFIKRIKSWHFGEGKFAELGAIKNQSSIFSQTADKKQEGEKITLGREQAESIQFPEIGTWDTMTFLNWRFVISFQEMFGKASEQTPPCLRGPPLSLWLSHSLGSIFNFDSSVPFSCVSVAEEGHWEIICTTLCSLLIHLLHLLGAYRLPGPVQGTQQGDANFVCTAPDSKYFRLPGSQTVSITSPHLCVCVAAAAEDP